MSRKASLSEVLEYMLAEGARNLTCSVDFEGGATASFEISLLHVVDDYGKEQNVQEPRGEYAGFEGLH